MLTLDDALKYVNLKTSSAKKVLGRYAVCRLFELHRTAQEAHPTRRAAKDLGAVPEVVRALQGECRSRWSSANGQAYVTNEPGAEVQTTR